MFWRLVGFGVLYYFVLMVLAAIAQVKHWMSLRLVCMYAMSMGLGVVFASILSVFLGYWFPSLAVPVFVVLGVWWCWLGWRHASGHPRLN
jgi:hypothetical protein